MLLSILVQFVQMMQSKVVRLSLTISYSDDCTKTADLKHEHRVICTKQTSGKNNQQFGLHPCFFTERRLLVCLITQYKVLYKDVLRVTELSD